MHGHLRETTEWMLQAALEKPLDEEKNLRDYQKRRQEKIRDWKEKALHGHIVRQTANVARLFLEMA